MFEMDKYRVTIEFCREIEDNEHSLSTESRLFPANTLSRERIEGGYGLQAAYTWLRIHGSHEARFEMQTILTENSEEVSRVLSIIQRQWLEMQGLLEEGEPETAPTQLDDGMAEGPTDEGMAAHC